MLYPIAGISMTLTLQCAASFTTFDYLAKIYARHPCACFRVLSTGLQINFLGKVQILNRCTGIYMGTCFNCVVIPHSERPHSVTVEPTLFLCKLIPIHQLQNASTSSIPHTSCIHSKNHGHHRSYFRFLNDTVFESVSACLYQYVYVCVCPEIYAIIHREEKRSSQDSAKFHVGSLERDLQPGTSQLPGRSDTNTTNWISITESIFCHSCTSKIAVA